MKSKLLVVLTILILNTAQSTIDLAVSLPHVPVHKCCEDAELLSEKIECLLTNETDSQPWAPIFTDERGRSNIQKDFKIIPGRPNCGGSMALSVFEYQGSPDRFFLLPDGILRHFIHYEPHIHEDDLDLGHAHEATGAQSNYFDHLPGTYCLDKVLIINKTVIEGQAAIICVPSVPSSWDVEKVIIHIVDPMLHLIGIACLTVVAVVYFVLPPLRDLVGNILSTISVCLIVSQAADLVRIFTQFSSHVSFLIADVVMYLSLLAAFFWLNSLGYYIWRTFRTRNVFLRVSDGRKYCYYSAYAWGTTIALSFVAIAAHFLFDEGKGFPVVPHEQETIGWLGIAMFFTPIAFTITVDIFFYLTTARAISRMSSYGRIHGRMKFSFALFIQLFLVMSTTWFFLLLSWLRYDALVFTYIVVNALQAPLILFICVLGQKSVRALLRKGCCRGDIEPHWGEEMMSMTSSY